MHACVWWCVRAQEREVMQKCIDVCERLCVIECVQCAYWRLCVEMCVRERVRVRVFGVCISARACMCACERQSARVRARAREREGKKEKFVLHISVWARWSVCERWRKSACVCTCVSILCVYASERKRVLCARESAHAHRELYLWKSVCTHHIVAQQRKLHVTHTHTHTHTHTQSHTYSQIHIHKHSSQHAAEGVCTDVCTHHEWRGRA